MNLFRVHCLLLSLVLVTTACRHPVPVARIETDSPVMEKEGEAYAGLLLRPTPDNYGALVSWVYPGPFKGTGFRSPYVNRGDILLSANGRVMTPQRFAELLKAVKPGDKLNLRVVKTGGKIDTAMPEPGSAQRIREFSIRLASKTEWSGPIEAERPAERVTAKDVVAQLNPSPYISFIRAQLAQHNLQEPVGKLLKLFNETQSNKNGYNTLSRINAGFQAPESLPEIEQLISDPLIALRENPERILEFAALNLDVPSPTFAVQPWSDATAEEMLQRVVTAYFEADAALQLAFKKIDPALRKQIPGSVANMLESMSVMEGEAYEKIQMLRASMQVDFQQLFLAAANFNGVLSAKTTFQDNLMGAGQPVPRELRKAIQGPIHAAIKKDGRWFIIGGSGPNVYDMAFLEVVIDPDGDDTYHFPKEDSAIKLVLDSKGDDKYQGHPGYACLGISIIVDHEGNDTYEAQEQSCGSAAFGISLLLDRKGADVYRASRWSLGAALYGVGALLDLGSENDVYWAETASQGIGGPRGFGLLFDVSGNDLYRANGPTPSAYGVPATFYGLSQGVGFGFRGYDSGGIGVLLDMKGNDRYEAGEFSQGGGYYWALGILDDRNGNDLYYGDRYSQGFGCHQAIGVLKDHSGNDTYWSMLAANQGGAWDIGMGLLLEMQGDDSYRADGLAQGGAAMQGIAWFLDLDGIDHYVARSGAIQGQSSSNTYHYNETGCMSWALFLDAGGAEDYYSNEERGNNSIQTTGKLNEKYPEKSSLNGLFIDTDAQLEKSENDLNALRN